MSKRYSPLSVGIFLVSGVALVIVGTLMFGSVRLFSRSQRFILYFDSSVKGLNIGAPVTLRGVKIGAVEDVLLHYNQRSDDNYIPVLIQIDDELLKKKSDRSSYFTDPKDFPNHVARGLRASLQPESLVTGVLFVELAYDRKATNYALHQEKAVYPEIPTVPTQVQTLIDNLASVDIRGLTDKISGLAERLDKTVAQLNLEETRGNLNRVLVSLDRVLGSSDITNSLAGLRGTIDDFRALSQKLQMKIDPLSDEVALTMRQGRETMKKVEDAVEEIRGAVAPEAALRQDLNDSLEQLTEAARSISNLADYLERNPKALLTGRSLPNSKP